MSVPVPIQPYPITYSFDPPERIARWRPLVHWILAIPHFVVLYALGIVAGVAAFVGWFLGVFTGRIPDGLLGVITMYTRYNVRVTEYLLFLQPDYPPFEFSTTATDPGTYPHTRLDVAREVEGRNRLTIFFRYFMVIPHMIVLFFIGLAMYVVLVIGFFAVLILGRWPAGLRSFVVGAIRWSTRVNAYFYLLTDTYPPFSLD
jgi:hypothetical protein